MSVRSLNKVMLIGNVTRDPNLRYTPNGAAVCSFGLATNRTWASADGGEKQERAEFHNLVAWSKLAEICGQLLGKGDKVYVEGRLQTREWKGDNNETRRTTEIVIDNMILLRSQTGKSGEADTQGEDMGMGGYTSGPEDDMSSEPAPKAAATRSKSAKKTTTAASDEDQVIDSDDVADDVPF